MARVDRLDHLSSNMKPILSLLRSSEAVWTAAHDVHGHASAGQRTSIRADFCFFPHATFGPEYRFLS